MKFVFACLMAGLSWSALAVADGTWSDSGIFGPSYTTILQQTEDLKREYPDLVTLVDYGKTVGKRTLRLMLVMKKDVRVASRPAMLMSGSTHGNEYLNIEDRLPAELLKASRAGGEVTQYLDQGGALIFVPILNPDGYDNRTRENGNGKDVNRDWTLPSVGNEGFTENETRLLAEKLETLREAHDLSFRVTVDYHCCAGVLLYPWSYESAPTMSESDLVTHQTLGDIAHRYLNVEVGTTPVLLGYSAVGTTKDYYYDRYRTAAFTYEGRHGTESKNLAKHVAWWTEMIKNVMTSDSSRLLASRKKKAITFPLFAE